MSNIEELRTKYIQEADARGSKPKLGFFSIPPCATAGNTEFQQKKVVKDQNDRVKTEERNIFSGVTASGVLKKSYFKFQPSIYQGEPYVDPGKHERLQALEVSKNYEDKDLYKPNSFQQTHNVKGAYEHVAEPPKKKLVKDVLDENGKVRTEERNIYSNLQTKIETEKIKKIKHMVDPYEGHLVDKKKEMKKDIQLRGQNDFRRGAPMKDYFATSREIFSNQGVAEKTNRKQTALNIAEHDSKFRPSCVKQHETFSYPQYMPGGKKQITKTDRKNGTDKPEVFKPIKHPNLHKPSPSISSLKTNIMRSFR